VHADLRRRKKSLPVAPALSRRRSESRQLAELYQQAEPFSDGQLLQIADLIERAGGRQWAEREAPRQLKAAMRCLAVANGVPGSAERMRDLVRLVAARNH
jgi:geranylgeranyl diphosphate synthase type I